MESGLKHQTFLIGARHSPVPSVLYFELSKYISRRKADFVNGMIAECFVVYNGEAVVVNASIQTRQEIMSTIEQLNPGGPSY